MKFHAFGPLVLFALVAGAAGLLERAALGASGDEGSTWSELPRARRAMLVVLAGAWAAYAGRRAAQVHRT